MMSLDAERQKAVLDAAMQLFAKVELKDISLDLLTKKSGVPAFDIIRHYQSGSNILKAVLERGTGIDGGRVAGAGAAHARRNDQRRIAPARRRHSRSIPPRVSPS